MRTHIVLPPCVWATVMHEYTTCLSTTPARVCAWHFVVESDDCEICREYLQTSLLVLIHVYLHSAFAPTSTPTTYIYVCMYCTYVTFAVFCLPLSNVCMCCVMCTGVWEQPREWLWPIPHESELLLLLAAGLLLQRTGSAGGHTDWG